MLTRWDPFQEMINMRNTLERMFDTNYGLLESTTRPLAWGLPLDVSETDDAFVVKASIPGIKPDDVEITVVEPKPAIPAPSVKVEAPKAVKTVKTEKKTVEKAKKTTAASKKITPAKALALNIASFTSLSEAQGLAGKLKKGGYNAYIASYTKDSIRWHRVRVGFFASRDEANRAGKAIQSKYRVEKPWIAKPDATELKTHL